MKAAFLKRIHGRLKNTPGFRWLDGLVIAVCFKLAVPFWLKICKLFLWLRLLGIAALEQKRLVVVARYGGIGDIICTFPAVAELVRQNPGNPVVYVVRRSFKALVERSGLDVKVLAVRNHLELPSKPSRVFKQSTYLAYPGEDWAARHLPGRLTDGFARCLGFAGATGQPSLRVDRAKADALRAEQLGRLGRTERRTPTPPEPANAAPNRSSALRQPLVLLHGGPTWAVKEWPIESWSRLVEKLKSELGCGVVQLVAARNITVKDPVCRLIPGAEPVECVDDIDRLIHLVAAVDLLVGIDSGPIHVAGAVGTPCVGLFGPTDPGLIFSNPERAAGVFHRVECSFCHHRHPRLHWMSGCPHDIQCLKGLTVEQVFDAVAANLSRAVGEPGYARKPINMPAAPATAISILIRTFNSGKTLERVMAALPLVEGDEFVVVDSGSTDATLAIASRRGARVIRPAGPFNYSKSLNLGFAAARNPWVLVLSSHCLPESAEMLDRLRDMATESDPLVAVIYGQSSLVRPWDAADASERIDKARWEQTRRQPGGNGLALYRRVCWRERPFDESLITAEDLEWFLWAIERGYCALRAPGIWALYRNQGSLAHMFRKGWQEVANARLLAGAEGPRLRDLCINIGSLCKKVLLGHIPPGAFLRQMAHALGTYLASVSPSAPPGRKRTDGGP